MLKVNLTLKNSEKEDEAKITELCDIVFGPGRFAKTAFRLREAYQGNGDFGFCIASGDNIVGSITFTPVKINGKDGAYLLGPLAVHPRIAGQGCGINLIKQGIIAARERAAKLVILVGDLSYYSRVGFVAAPEGHLNFPGPVDSRRILVSQLEENALPAFQGKIHV
ncbi:MAG: GNAT family N-acetyltransferase [Methyloligellaceae bacterium]